MDVYARLQDRLNEHPSGAPASAAFDKILRVLFSPEEATIACHLNFEKQSLDSVVHQTGLVNSVELKATLDGMTERGCIMGVKIGGIDYYALLPTIPGFYEFPFMRKENYTYTTELASLWQEYLDEEYIEALAGSPTPQMRVIPVQKTIPVSNEVLPYARVAEMLDKTEVIAVTNCACKEIMNNCQKSREVCMAFDNSARYLLDKGWAREISKEETLKILKKTEEEGMVHCVRNSQDKLTILCNCCSCCCILLRGLREFNIPNSIATSAYIVKFHEEKCIGCLQCTDDRCPTRAIKTSDNIIEIAADKCIGCGLCVTICPSHALIIQSRIIPPPVPLTEKDLMKIVRQEKGK